MNSQKQKKRRSTSASGKTRQNSRGNTYYYKSSNSHKKVKKKRRMRKELKFALVTVSILLVMVLGIFTYVSARDLKRNASLMKGQLKTAVQCLKDEDTEGASLAMNQVVSINEELKSQMDTPLWFCARMVPVVGKQVSSARELLDIVDQASTDLIYPAIDLMVEYPVSGLKVGDGQLNATMAASWLQFTDDHMPEIYEISSKVVNLELSLIDRDGKIAKYQDKLNFIVTDYDQLTGYIDVIKNIIGDGQTNKYYIFMAQNQAELRASGGFPGSVGSIQINNGVLTIGDFTSVWKVLSSEAPESAGVTQQEVNIFSQNMLFPRDSVDNPDFKRVGEIISSSYEAYNGIHVDGVISMTPTVIQKLINITGDITLSDGTVMTGDNATYELQYGIYFRYYYKNAGASPYDADSLFAETAKAAMSAFTSSFSISNIMDYFQLLSDGVENRLIQIYMKDAEQESTAIHAGVAGVLNPGVNNAVAGVYISVYDPSKLGWWVYLSPTCSAGVKNIDGTTTYDVTVTLNNTITDEEINAASEYIIGSNGGAIATHLQLVAPIGGSISDISASNGMEFSVDEYNGAQIYYKLGCLINPEDPITITYKVTVASDVTDSLRFSTTPTLQDYH